MMFDGRIKKLFVWVCVVLGASGLGFFGATKAMNVYLKKEPVDLRRSFSDIPRTLEGRNGVTWKQEGTDKILTEDVVSNLGTDKYLTRDYVRTGEGMLAMGVSVNIAYYTGMIDAIPHIPDRCFVAAGLDKVSTPTELKLNVQSERWEPDEGARNIATGEPYPILQVLDRYTNRFERVRMPLGDFGIRVTEFQDPKTPNARIFAGYFFVANGRTTADPEDIRLLAFKLSEKYAYYAKIQFTMAIPREAMRAEAMYQEAISSLTESMLPELMRCLPDWSEVEQRGAKGTTEIAGTEDKN